MLEIIKSTTFLDLRELDGFCGSFAGNFQRFCCLNINSRGHALQKHPEIKSCSFGSLRSFSQKASDLEKKQSTPKTPKNFMDLESPGKYISIPVPPDPFR